MKKQAISVILDPKGVDEVSNTVGAWLKEAGIAQRDISRIRLTLEEILFNICTHTDGNLPAEISFLKRFGAQMLRIRYGGERFDPRKSADNELEEFTSVLLTQMGIFPVWRWRLRKNEVILNVTTRKKHATLLTFGCVALAIVLGLSGSFIPEAVRTAVTDYGLSFLSSGFLNLLNTFIGLMIFLTVITGICGMGSTAALGRIGKQMITRFLLGTFLCCAAWTAAARLFFPLAGSTGEASSGFRSILELIFGILPSNPVKPFLDGNTLQIVFMAVMIGIVLLVTGSQTENLRNVISELQMVVMRCVTAVCVLLPLYIFSSLVIQLWTSGPQLLVHFWKPLVLSVVFCAVLLCLYTAYTSWKMKVKPSVLISKLIPDFIIALTTSSSSAAFATGMEINEKQLGIDNSLSRMGFPIGGILYAGSYSLLYVLAGAFVAECYGVHADLAWWVTLWIVCSLLGVSTPPVAGGSISCLSVMMAQLHIPAEGLAISVALAMFLDFICTGTRIPVLHMELILQADHLGLINTDVLCAPSNMSNETKNV